MAGYVRTSWMGPIANSAYPINIDVPENTKALFVIGASTSNNGCAVYGASWNGNAFTQIRNWTWGSPAQTYARFYALFRDDIPAGQITIYANVNTWDNTRFMALAVVSKDTMSKIADLPQHGGYGYEPDRTYAGDEMATMMIVLARGNGTTAVGEEGTDWLLGDVGNAVGIELAPGTGTRKVGGVGGMAYGSVGGIVIGPWSLGGGKKNTNLVVAS